jgi:hypothetical protein
MPLALALLGTFEVRRDGQPIHEFRAQSVRALLAYLALEANRPHEREHLCALLWPDNPLPAAREVSERGQGMARRAGALIAAGTTIAPRWGARRAGSAPDSAQAFCSPL